LISYRTYKILSITRTVILFAALSCLSTAALAAQKAPAREAFYRCKDASGQTHYGDSKPPQCEGLDTEVLNDHGMVVRVIEGSATRVVREQRDLVENRAKEERDQKLQRDRMLIETYLTVEDIERLRDQRLEQLDSQYRVTELSIRNLRERQTALQSQIARFKPYSDKPEAPALPDHLAEEMVLTVNGMRVYQEMLAKTRAEQAQMTTSFDSDIKRFKELKGVK
jgi:hypothetical protein